MIGGLEGYGEAVKLVPLKLVGKGLGHNLICRQSGVNSEESAVFLANSTLVLSCLNPVRGFRINIEWKSSSQRVDKENRLKPH